MKSHAHRRAQTLRRPYRPTLTVELLEQRLPPGDALAGLVLAALNTSSSQGLLDEPRLQPNDVSSLALVQSTAGAGGPRGRCGLVSADLPEAAHAPDRTVSWSFSLLSECEVPIL